MNYNSKMGYSGNEQDYQLVKASLGKLKLQKELLRYLTNVLPNPTDIVSLDNAQNTVKSVKAQLANKNLLPYPYAETTKTVKGITFTDNGDGTITATGTVEKGQANFYLYQVGNFTVKKGTYRLSGCPSGGIVGGNIHYALVLLGEDGMSRGMDLGDGITVTFSTDVNLGIVIGIWSGITVENLVFKPQLELGTTATAYTPYFSDFSTVKVTGCGKNLIQTNIIEVTSPNAVNKLIWQGNISGKLSFSLDNSEYINSSTPGAANFEFVFGDGTSKYLAANVQHIYLNTFSPLKEIHFLNWGQGTGVLKNIQLEIGSSETDYEPYQGQTYTPTATGEVTGIEILTPTTNIINDKGLLFTKVTGDDFNYIN